ncbi:MAG TPA: hypothetical protein VF766_15285, partial [Pyrinomonadaceae bacterium]
KSGLVLSWLIHMGFSVDEISAMESNLLNLSVSIDIAFREAHALKAIVDKLLEDSYSLSSGVNKLWWSEFGRQLDWHLKERQKQREQAEATRRRQAEKRAAETTPKADQPRFRNADEMGIYYDLRARESELMQQLAEVDKKAAALPPGTSSSDLQEQREDLLIQLKQVRAKLQTYQVQSRP